MRFLLLCLLAVVSVWGQGLADFLLGFPIQLRDYLEITDAQATKISQQNSEFARWSSVRSQRMYEVQSEIFVETARDPLDPAALGVRSAEVEAIRREITERNAKLIAANVAVLTPAQVVKLKALEEAMKMVGASSQAQSVKLLPDGCSNLPGFVTGAIVPAPVIFDPAGGRVGFSVFSGYCAPRISVSGIFAP